MAVNLRLTHVVKDREVQKFQVNGSELLIRFVNVSTIAQVSQFLIKNEKVKDF
jgi:hypothetical protein